MKPSANTCKQVVQIVLPLMLAWAIACALSFFTSPAHATGSEFVTGGIDTAGQATTWPDFRGSPTNNAVSDAKTPTKNDDAGLLWSVKFNDGYVSPEIIVNDEVIVTSGRSSTGTITKLNKKTGEVIASASMKSGSSYSLMPPTYADGKVFVALSNGGMEAFDVKTLKSLWYYKNSSGGQGNSPVVYSDGLVFTGYWSGETAERSFVCVDATTGKQVWEKPNVGGYYWAGALVVGDFLLFGCDDGASADKPGDSYVRCVDKRTGVQVSSVKLTGDQRSSISYDPDLGRIYFTTKPGYLHSASIDADTGVLSDLKSLKIDLETTATPLVYGGRVYVGASSGGFDKGSLSVVDAETLNLLYKLDGKSGIKGTVKSAPLVSTAYAGSDSDYKLYLYITVNNPPGGITMVSVEPGSTKASQARVVDLFTPPSAMQQYCIASIICDNDGYLYYRNDSNYLMCIGPEGASPSDDDQSSGSSESSSSGSRSSGGKPGKSSGSSAGRSSAASGSTSAGADNGTNGSGRSTVQRQSGAVSGSNVGSTVRNGTSASSTSGNSSKSAESKSKTSSDGANSSTANQGQSKRHTDSEVATGHLSDEPDSTGNDWLVPAAIASAALLAMIGAFVARMIISRRQARSGFLTGLDDGSDESEGPDGSYGR